MNKKIIVSFLFVALILVMAACSTQSESDSPLVGTTAPGFTLANTSGGQTSLSDYQGTPVLLFFHMAVG